MGFESLTPEQRRENALKGQATRAAKAAAAQAEGGVAVMERPTVSEPVVTERIGHTPSKLELLMAQGPKRVHVEQDVSGHESLKGDIKAGERATTTSDTIAPYLLYIHGRARSVPTGNLQVNLAAGFSIVCDLCGEEHPESETNPNACSVLRGDKGIVGIRCPVCAKVIYGEAEGIANLKKEPSDDPYIIDPKPVGDARAVAQVKWEKHMAVFHETAAATYGIDVTRIQAEVARIPAGAPI